MVREHVHWALAQHRLAAARQPVGRPRLAAGSKLLPAGLKKCRPRRALLISREQLLVVAVVVHRIDGRGIDDQQGRGVVAVEESRIGLREFLEIARSMCCS